MLSAVPDGTDTLISPAFEYESYSPPISDWDEAIFSSARAVEAAGPSEGRRAWCVGDATAVQAQAAGFHAASAGGNVEDLVRMILSSAPAARLMHFRAKVSRGNVRDRLVAEGLQCGEAVVYGKVAQPPSKALLEVTQGERAIILPLFSPETASIVAKWGLSLKRAIVIAMSPAIAKELSDVEVADMQIALTPDMDAMWDKIIAVIA